MGTRNFKSVEIDMRHPKEEPLRLGSRSAGLLATVVTLGLMACGGEPDAEPAPTNEAPASRATQATAVVELGEDSYTFERVTCDLDDSMGDDVLLRARGTATDGRSTTLEVERREVGDALHDRVTLYFGRIVEGDQWHAYATGRPGGPWATHSGGKPLDGPLVAVEAGGLTAEGTFAHETLDATRPGSVRVRCDP